MDTSDENKKLTSSQLRKIKKPLIEKRRRERINESLSQLKHLILEALNKDENQYNKMEKADILELTVKHLKSLMKQQQSHVASSRPRYTAISPAVPSDPPNKYKDGFIQCASEVQNYMQKTGNVRPDLQNQLTNHLNNCVQDIHSSATQKVPTSAPQVNGYVHILPKDSVVVGGECLTSPVLQGIPCVQQIPVINGQTIVLANAVPGFNSQSLQPMLQLAQPVLTNGDSTNAILANGNSQKSVFTNLNTQVSSNVNCNATVFRNEAIQVKPATDSVDHRLTNNINVKPELAKEKLSIVQGVHIDSMHQNQSIDARNHLVLSPNTDNINKFSIASPNTQHERTSSLNTTLSKASPISINRVQCDISSVVDCQQNININATTTRSDSYCNNNIRMQPSPVNIHRYTSDTINTQKPSTNAINRNFLYQQLVPVPDTVWRPW